MSYAHGIAAGVAALLLGLGLLAGASADAIRKRWRRHPQRWRWFLAALGLILSGAAVTHVSFRWRKGTIPLAVIDVRMLAAYQPSRAEAIHIQPPYILLAGDLHAHVAPPDEAYHVIRGLDGTLDLARREGLDFIALTPHIWTPYLNTPGYRQGILAGHRWLTAALTKADLRGLLVTAGAESTDDDWGHVGMAFGDYDSALAAMTDDEVDAHLGDFFQRYVDSGGLLTLHHPLAQPQGLAARGFGVDISWRPFTFPQTPPPHQIAAADRLAVGVEAYNLQVSELRDWFSFGDRHTSIREVLARMDQEILTRQRRLVPVAGTDSHGDFLRPVLFVLARDRSLEAVREAILEGRTCVRDRAACALTARRPGGPWVAVGSSLAGVETIEFQLPPGDASLLANGKEVARSSHGKIVQLHAPRDTCLLARVVVDGGYSAPIYINCPFMPQTS